MDKGIDSEKITGLLLPGGKIAEKLKRFEERSSQLELIELIVRAFNENALVAAEAGTGVGKSFAYLLPAVFFVLREKERLQKSGDDDEREGGKNRVVISTAAINLQQQLFEKDIPFVFSALDVSLKTALVKGRGNYLCLRRLSDAINDAAYFSESERVVLQKIADWSKETKTGEKTELPVEWLPGVWPQAAAEPDSCMGKKCPFRGRCFVLAARKNAFAADILVVNHHLLFADLAAREGRDLNDGTLVLPPYSRVIIDEAHNIENAATSFFSEQFSLPALLRTVNRLYRYRRGISQGLLARAAAALSIIDLSPFDKAANELKTASEKLSSLAVSLCGTGGGDTASTGTIRLSAKTGAKAAALQKPFLEFRNAVAAFAELSASCAKKLEAKADSMTGDDDDHNHELVLLSWEIASYTGRLKLIENIAASYLEWREKPESVFWIEKKDAAKRRGGGGGGGNSLVEHSWAVFNITPLEIAGRLKEALWDKAETAVCVSATLTVAGSFQYFFRQSGLDRSGLDRNGLDGGGDGDRKNSRAVLSGTFPSPFPYEKSVLFAVPSDAPLPAEAGFRAFVDETSTRLCEISGGRAIVLFTSYESMTSAFFHAAPRLRELEIPCYKQGDDDRARLLERFKQEKESVLFATDSFWEGVDVPGEALSLLILARLPFRMPGEPVFEARCEAVERGGAGVAGESSFFALSIPEAVMKFRQGFGRLIRTASDRGVVAALDGRILRKPYGQLFLRSLPKTKVSFAPVSGVCRAVESFFFP
jgi:ATP-dependent DNA helicase DinG